LHIQKPIFKNLNILLFYTLLYTDPILVFFGTEIAYAPKQFFFQPVCGVFQAKNG